LNATAGAGTDQKFVVLSQPAKVTFNPNGTTNFIYTPTAQQINALTAGSRRRRAAATRCNSRRSRQRTSSSSLSLDAAAVAQLEAATFEIAALPDHGLGATAGAAITLSPDAAGWGWFVDPNASSDVAFIGATADGLRRRRLARRRAKWTC
jgi:hypothetical protein